MRTMLEIHPDFAIPFPDSGTKLSDFKEKVEAACRTAELLGLDDTPGTEDLIEAEQAVYAAVDPDEKKNKQALKASESFKPATYYAVNGLLKEYSVRVVDNATQIRLMVTNKLILESENPDARIRMRALELLGKITDVGLFTEKSEVTVTHRSTEELISNVRSKIAAMREPKDITPTTVLLDGRAIDLKEELGL
jgi:hypothetical protein